MLTHLMTFLSWLYVAAAVWLAVYGLNMLVLTGLFSLYRSRRKKELKPRQPFVLENWPLVTVQLPLFNEQEVARRLIDAVAGMDYPKECLQIQVLDDSTDSTVQIVDQSAASWQACGTWIEVVRREDRTDFKAGALRAGLEKAKGEFIAIFDADFVPPTDWLKRALVPFFKLGSERVGLVQTRWGHLNEEFSILTRAQALALDGHFGVEQNARYLGGLLLNFNGTAGIWRRSCIDSAGNWRGATLTEDLDLSYRAQLKGWKIVYLPDVTAPAELPAFMGGFKRQQFRWAKGSIQVARLLGPEIIKAPISPWRKLQGILHLTGYFGHPLMLLLVLLLLPLSIKGNPLLQKVPLGWLGVASLGAPALYAVSQATLYGGKRGLSWIIRFPFLAMLGVGIAVNNTRAVLEALAGVRSTFERTPKIGQVKKGNRWQSGRHERIRLSSSTWLELLLVFYALAITIVTIKHGNYIGGVFAALYTLGFAWVTGATVWEARRVGSSAKIAS